MVQVWDENGKPVEIGGGDTGPPDDGTVWVWGENGEPTMVPEETVAQSDPGSAGEGMVWVWGENGEPVAVARDSVPGLADASPAPDGDDVAGTP